MSTKDTNKKDSLDINAQIEWLDEQINTLCEQRIRLRAQAFELGFDQDEGFSVLESHDFSNARVVFQGVEGAYSQQAMHQYFGTEVNGTAVATWKDAMEAIQKGEADYAVLPIENSSAGIVSENYDLLVEYDNYIVGEQIIKIQHELLGLPESSVEQILNVYSHPQALMQCSEYLDAHKTWKKNSLENTALAAKKVKEDNDCSQAAIAGKINAQLYGLKILEPAIQNNKNNSTRFIIVTGKKICTKEASHISICFELVHESGSLYRALSHLIYNKLNMTNIQSRPLGDRNWEYRFFVDFEGQLNDEAVLNAMRGLRRESASLKILGTY